MAAAQARRTLHVLSALPAGAEGAKAVGPSLPSPLFTIGPVTLPKITAGTGQGTLMEGREAIGERRPDRHTQGPH